VLRGARSAADALRRFLAERHAAEEGTELLLRDLTPCLEAALLLDDRDLVELLERKMAPAAGCVTTLGSFTSVGRLLGAAATFHGPGRTTPMLWMWRTLGALG
jgi:hypothetical protein